MTEESTRAPSSIVGVEQASSRRRCTSFLFVLLSLVMASPIRAQARVVQTHRAREPEGRLIAFYAAAMTFSPLGGLPNDSRLSLGVEATWLPHLSVAQRRPGIDKPESTNLAPVIPRPRLALRLPVNVVIEGSWIPPVPVDDARANIFSGAISQTFALGSGVGLTPRVSGVVGRVKGAITCNASTARSGGPALAVYYLNVCHDHDSEDWFEPRQIAGELMVSRSITSVHAELYALGGARIDRSRFDIGVIRADGSRDPDHPILRLRDTRPHMAAGARWRLTRKVATAAEWFYAPGSLATVRLFAGWVP